MDETVTLTLRPETDAKDHSDIVNETKNQVKASFESLVGAGAALAKSYVKAPLNNDVTEIKNVSIDIGKSALRQNSIATTIANAIGVDMETVLPWVGEIPEDVGRFLEVLENPLKALDYNLDFDRLTACFEEIFERRMEEEENASIDN